METTTAPEQTKEDRVLAVAFRAPEPVNLPPAWLPGTARKWIDDCDAAARRELERRAAA